MSSFKCSIFWGPLSMKEKKKYLYMAMELCNWSEFHRIEFDNQIIAFANDKNSDSDTNNNNKKPHHW